MPMPLTEKEVIKRLKLSNIKLLEPYSKSMAKHKFKCLVCDNIWVTVPNSIFNGRGCRKCGYDKIRNIGKIKLIRKLKNKNIKLLGEYKSYTTKCKFVCGICDYIWNTMPQHIIYGHGCPRCGNKSHSNTNIKIHKDWLKYLNKTEKSYKDYRRLCERIMKISNKYFLFFKNNTDNHLDHKRSIMHCFEDNIPPEIASSPCNLQLLRCKDNVSKSYKSCIDKNTLLKEYKKFIKINTDYLGILGYL